MENKHTEDKTKKLYFISYSYIMDRCTAHLCQWLKKDVNSFMKRGKDTPLGSVHWLTALFEKNNNQAGLPNVY